MTLLIPHITQAEAATVINVVIVFLQYTLALALVALLVYFVPPVNSALAWNVIGRSLHGSLWLHSYAQIAQPCAEQDFALPSSRLLLPLGLGAGPALLGSPKNVTTSFVDDTFPLGLAMSPRGSFVYGRVCGTFAPATCPGNSNGNESAIAPEILARFNATPYSTFGMEFRRYYIGTAGYNYSVSNSQFSTTESLILRSGIFAVGGLIVDMDNPGIGLRQHTFPAETPHGGVWSEDVLWLEPVSTCVDTNLTIDYMLTSSASTNQMDGQNINLWQHAYKGAVLSNAVAMGHFNNLTRNETYYGRTFPLNDSVTLFFAGKMQSLRLGYLDSFKDIESDLSISCQGYGGADTANITNVGVRCYIMLAPPQRSDNGDPRRPADNSTWTQHMFSCAGVTRARMQRLQFSFNGTMDLSALSISRSNIDTPVLWATERTNLNITGRVADSLEEDPSLWTTRSDVFYILAGGVDTWANTLSPQPSALPALTWSAIQQIGQDIGGFADYGGVSNFALLNKFQTLLSADPQQGPSLIQSLVWTDLMANNALGTASSSSILVRPNVPAISYDLRFAVPTLLLFLLWVPLFGGAAFVLIAGLLKFSYVRHLLNNTGAGRIALGNSALKPVYPDPSRHMGATAGPGTPLCSEDEKRWVKGAGRTPVSIQPAGWGTLIRPSVWFKIIGTRHWLGSTELSSVWGSLGSIVELWQRVKACEDDVVLTFSTQPGFPGSN
ncbi:hypothetical protein B0H19DRAFT_1227913 [Mycena capillaripes]|nr:hypothetical protein B0H19DRAFT_1227913 [Mycena capillaripes]